MKEIRECLGYRAHNYVKEQQALQREEMAAIRLKEKEERVKLETAQLEKNKADVLLQLEQQSNETEVKLKKEATESELKVKQVKHIHQMELLDMKKKTGVCTSDIGIVRPKCPKLPVYEKGKD